MKRIVLVIERVFFLMVFSVVLSRVCVVTAADPTVVSIYPVNQTVSAGDVLSVTIMCSPQQVVKAFELKVSFDPSLLQATNVTEGDIFDGFTTFFYAGVINNSAGTIMNIYDLIVGEGNVTETGSLVLITFTAKSYNGTSAVNLYDVLMTNETDYIEVNVFSGGVTVIEGSDPPDIPPPSEPPVTPPGSDNIRPSPPLKPVGETNVTVGTLSSYRSAASDPDGDVVRLRFDWGDGVLSNWTDFVASNTPVFASHAWGDVSNYSIRVIAQDTDGLNSSWSESLTVRISLDEAEGSLPVGMFNVPANASSNQTLVFDTSGLYDPDGEIVLYQWDFGDGITGFGENPMHTYETPGTYTVTLTVIDDTGLMVTMSKVVTIVPASESAVPTANEANLFQSNIALIILAAVVLPFLIIFMAFRDRIEAAYLRGRIVASRRRLAQLEGSPADINQIIDKLFFEMNQKVPFLTRDSILGAYNEMVRGMVEQNATYRPPGVSIEEIEKLVDRRIQSIIEAKVDKL